jgi:outer membrane protein TolC
MRHIAVARINTLLNLPPDARLPLPPEELRADETLPEAGALRALALARRPDLRALADRIAADEAALALANKDFYPDFSPFAMYDRFMGNNSQTQPLATMLGVSVNLPVRRSRRFGEVAEAQARLSQRRAELAKQINQVNYEVEQAYAQVTQTQKALRLYEQTVLPKAQANLDAARAAYVPGRINFLTLLEAERSLIGLRDRYYELLASYHSRRATLERVSGGSYDGPGGGVTRPGCR